jgi:S1-C subfamily serine protease
VVTNKHVVEKREAASVTKFVRLKKRNSIGSSKYFASVVFVSPKYDLALIEIQTPPTEVFQKVALVSAEDWNKTTLYTKMYLVSCGLGTPSYVTNGNLSEVNRRETKMGFTTNIIYGSSGGGIFNAKGELVGICNAMKATGHGLRRYPVSHHALGIPITTLRKVIEGTKYKFILGEPEPEEEEELEWDWDDFPELPDMPPVPQKSKKYF